MMEQTLHLDIVTDKVRGKTRSTMTERKRGGGYARGDKPVRYVYVHDTGCMRMLHPELYASREIAGRSRHSPNIAVPHDLAGAIRVATRHLVRYQGDGMDHTERQLDVIRKSSERYRKAREPKLVHSTTDVAK